MVFDEVAHLLGLCIDVVAVVLAACDGFERVFAKVVDDFVADDESQLGLVLNLRHQTGAYEHHALTCGESVDFGRFDGVETQLAAQLGVIGQQGVGDALYQPRDGVTIQDAPRGHQLVDVV